MTKPSAILRVAVATAALSWALQAQAQEQTQAAASPEGQQASTEGAASPTGLDEIVVTAQFKRENLQKAAVAVAVVSGDNIAKAGVTGPAQLTGLVPALQISQGGGNTQSFFVRGVGTVTNNSYTDPGVAFNIDGVYVGRPTSVRNTFFDIERVEVLKGPQGTLYGRNATGGAVNVLPNKPQLGKFSGGFGASYGNYDDVGINGFLNVPIGENAAARLAGTYNSHDGYLSDGSSDAKGYALRGQLLFEPSSDITVRIGADYAHDGGRGPGSTVVAKIDPFTGGATNEGFDRSIGFQDPRTTALLSHQYNWAAGRFMDGFTDPTHVHNSYWGINGQVDADLGFSKLTLIASHRASDINSLEFTAGFGSRTLQKDNQESVELRLASPDTGLIRWLGGLYYYNEKIQSDYQFNFKTLTAFQDLDTGTTAKAAFARVTLAPTDGLRFVGGIRYTDEKKKFNGVNPVFVSLCTAPAVPINSCGSAPFFPFAASADAMVTQMGLIQVTPPAVDPAVFIQPSAAAANSIFLRPVIAINNRLNTKKTTFRAAVEYDVGPNSLLYASFENGFHAGGFSFAQIAPSFKPETIDAYTIGSKNRFFGGALQINAELFLWKYKNQQITHFATDLSGALVYVTENAGASTNKGFEIEAKVKATPTTVLSLNAQYLDAKYDSFTYSVPAGPTSPPLVSGCPSSPVTGQPLLQVNCAGFTALRSPKWTINAGIEQKISLGNHEIVLSADTRYQSRSMVAFEMLPGVTEQEAYFTTNLAVEFHPIDGNWTLGAFVNNVENHRPIGQALFDNQSNTFASSPLPPRTYGVRTSVKF